MENTYSTFNKLTTKAKQTILSKEAQSKITHSKILIINLNTAMTELTKKLIQKGFNIYLYDKAKITHTDITTNYYLNENDLGKDRAKTILERLNHLSAVVSITIIDDIAMAKDINFGCLGFRNFTELANYEEYFTRKNIIYYCVNTSGIYGFYYNNIKIKKNGEVAIDNLSFVKKSCNYLSQIKQNPNFDKVDWLVYSIYLLELFYRKNVSKVNLQSEMVNESIDQKQFQKRLFYIENYFKLNKINLGQNKTKLMDILKKLIVNYNKEFNPICVMMGELVSSQIYNYIVNNSLPQTNIVTYNSEIESFDYLTFLSA